MSRLSLRRSVAGPMVVALFTLAMALSACDNDSSDTPTPTEPAGASELDADAVQSTVRVAEMWGHLETSAASMAAGNSEDATLHSARPVAEYWALVSPSLSEVGQADAVRAAIDAYEQAVLSGGDTEQAVEDVREALLAAMDALSDGEFDTPEFRAAVIRDLVESIEHEYEEAIEEGSLTNLPEYQDAWGFLRVATRLYEPIKSEAEELDSEAAHEIEEELEALEEIFSDLRPTDVPGEIEDVEDAVGEIRAELAKVFSLEIGAAATPQETVEQIEEMLEHSLDEYEAGELDEAYEYAANAYLEGFEHIEGAIIQAGRRDLVEDLELKFKDFRDGVRDEASIETLQQLKTDIETGLDEALEALG